MCPSLALFGLSLALLMLRAEFSMKGRIFTRCWGTKRSLIKSRVLLSARERKREREREKLLHVMSMAYLFPRLFRALIRFKCRSDTRLN